ncbi:MAG: hypothetical protein Q7T33_01205, partial [Dehalococcoidia bacterium]|nr:hypothetical protein [Dehalococcoidia bacterium]
YIAAVLSGTQAFTGLNTFQGQVAVSSDLYVTNGRLGIGTASPGAALDVAGAVQFGAGAAKSTFTAAGSLNIASGSGITLAGGGLVTGLAGPAGPLDAVNKAYIDGLTGGGAIAAVLSGTQAFTGQNSFGGQVAVSSDLYVTNGRLGIGTASPGAALDVEGAAQFGAGAAKSTFTAAGSLAMAFGSSIAFAGAGIVTGLADPSLPADAANKAYVDSLTGGGLPLAVLSATQTFTGRSSLQGRVTVSSSLFVTNGSLGIGIGTAGPGAKLEVRGGSVTIRGSDSYPAIAGFADAGGNYRVVITTAGRVGIGTAEPEAALHLSGPGNLPVLVEGQHFRLRHANGTAAAPLPLLSGDSIGGYGFSGYGATGFRTAATAAIRAVAAENFTDAAQGAWLDFDTTPIGSTIAVTRMRIEANGNTGIGTTAPDHKLQVDGTADSTVRINSADMGSAYLRLTEAAATDNGGMFKYDGLNNRFEIGTLEAGVEIPAVYIPRNSGNVGIGTEVPTQKLDVNGLVRVGRYSAAGLPACNGDALGSLGFNTAQNKPYVCTAAGGGTWKPVASDSDNDGIADWADQDDGNTNVKTAALLPGNIKYGVTVFGVTGTLGAASCKAIFNAGLSSGDGVYL